jgi:hypothetical protein
MRLFIKIVNGQPFEHPILAENFIIAYPHIDVDNLPSDFANFERTNDEADNLSVGVYEVPYSKYEWVGNVVKDVWYTRPMTEVEIAHRNETLVLNMEGHKSQRLIKWNAVLSELTDDANKQVVQNYIDILTAYVIADAPLADLPKAPLKNEDGTYTPRS